MDVYLLDQNYKKQELLSGFVSFIWKEKWNGYGDFELKIPFGHSQTQLITVGKHLYIDPSSTLMVIERYERIGDSSGDLMVIKGRSILSILTDRVIDPREVEGRAPTVAAGLVNRVCVQGLGVSPGDVFPNLQFVWPPEFGPTINYETGYANLYDEVVGLANAYDFGLRMDYHPTSHHLTFRIIKGEDKTRNILFCWRLGNIQDLQFLRTREDYRNVAYVTHKQSSKRRIIYASHLDSTVSGFDRRVVHVEYDGDDPTDINLLNRGRRVLNERRIVDTLEGELIADEFVYGSDYNLGDLVRVRDESGKLGTSRVTEYIWSVDNQGSRAYPSFTSAE